MPYTIYRLNSSGPVRASGRTKVCRVDSLEAARRYFERLCDERSSDPELDFEVDPDGHDAADVAVIGRFSIDLYTVESDAA